MNQNHVKQGLEHSRKFLDEFRAFQEVFPEDKTLISELERGQRKLECFVRQ